MRLSLMENVYLPPLPELFFTTRKERGNMLNKALPLSHVGTGVVEGTGIQLSELNPYHFFIIRGKVVDSEFVQAVKTATRLDLPSTPLSMAADAESAIFWLGPTEWLLKVHEAHAQTIADRIGEAPLVCVDVTSGYTLLELKGAAVTSLIKKACHYDFHDFQEGKCVQTNIAKTSGLIWRSDASYFLWIRRSFADYLQQWLEDASREYGYSFVSVD